MHTNMLKLNDDKTEFLVIRTKQQLSKVEDLSIQIGQDKINGSAYMRNLGFYFNQNMKNTAHVNWLSSSLHVTTKNIFRICHLIDNMATKTLIQMLVLSCLDFCNSILLGSTKYNLNKLQMIQNLGCRVIFKAGKYTHVTTLFMELHWLSVQDRITYKILVLMFNCIHQLALKYLSDLVVSAHNRELRSSTQNKLPVSHYRTSQTHTSSFSSMGSRLWKSLPQQIRDIQVITIFKRDIKTLLFTETYVNGQ